MRILLTGGGSGGHITPLLAVGHEIKKLVPDAELLYVGERHGKFQQLVQGNPLFERTDYIFAGKFRRYAQDSWIYRLTDVKTLFLNLRDVIYVILGFFQGWRLLGQLKPDVIFVKGGFVGLPVGLAAALRGIPFITHDSDSSPGLTNRIIGRWAKRNTTALPKQFYAYSKDRIMQVGVPLSEHYHYVTEAQKAEFRIELNLPKDAQVLVITGGSQGASSMNHLLAPQISALLQNNPTLYVIHQIGKKSGGLYKDVPERLQTPEFIGDLFRYTAAADVVISRASATTVAELAEQGRACILIPGNLAGGHQEKNAGYLEDHKAALVFSEKQLQDQPDLITEAVTSLLTDITARERLADQLRNTALAGASHKLALLLVSLARGGQ